MNLRCATLSEALGFQLLGLTMKGFVRMSCFHPTLFAPVSFADTCWQAKAGTLKPETRDQEAAADRRWGRGMQKD
jgi:hypothetical protein